MDEKGAVALGVTWRTDDDGSISLSAIDIGNGPVSFEEILMALKEKKEC